MLFVVNGCLWYWKAMPLRRACPAWRGTFSSRDCRSLSRLLPVASWPRRSVGKRHFAHGVRPNRVAEGFSPPASTSAIARDRSRRSSELARSTK
jgi:hypothetical protein